MAEMLRKQLLDTSRGRIVTLLQAGELTAEDIATKLGLTRSAVRIQITAMERDGVVRKVGKRPGTTRPSHLFELTPEVEQFLSKAYVPVLTHLVDVSPSRCQPSRSRRCGGGPAQHSPMKCLQESLLGRPQAAGR
jgi:predicted ArsR family transcriptional regulator